MKTVSNLTTAELVSEYNALTGKQIKKFSSRAAGEKQVSMARANASIDKSKFAKPEVKAAPAAKPIMDIKATEAFAKKLADDKAAKKAEKQPAAKPAPVVFKPAPGSLAEQIAAMNGDTKEIIKVDERKGERRHTAAKVVVIKPVWKLEDGCPKCGTKEDQTAAGLEGTAAGDSRMFCHHCSNEYFSDTGKTYKAPAASADRSKSISESWNNPEVAAKRARRDHVMVSGKIYRSVLEAFKTLNLPQQQHIKFRMALKAEGKKAFELGNKKYEFALVAKEEAAK